ncbi:MAG: 2-keto-4-pentenoate hydratase [Proteobacteria bacterium]|nr:2-keto-4-pentenoate hydratase [Burkholderiales bacterium]
MLQWTRAGRRRVGRKVALTSVTVQRMIGVDAPASGVLFDDMLLNCHAVVPLTQLNQARAEAEVALVLKAALPQSRPTYIDVLGAIDYALPAIEIVDSRIRGWDVGAFDFIADNAAACLVVLGDTPFDIRRHDLTRIDMSMTVDGEAGTTGSGAECMGSPLRALHWLAMDLARRGDPLQAGEVIMAGALGAVVQIARSCRVDARIGLFAPVGVTFS